MTEFSLTTETNLSKIQFLNQLNLVTENMSSENESSKALDKNFDSMSNQHLTLFEKNNNTKTGYEDFCIMKGSIKLLPLQDFDFIGKHVICLKCCKKFASKMVYKAHVGTNTCVRTYDGPNRTYLEYKNKNGRRGRKNDGHDVNKDLLNPEMLNTFQTRNKCYANVVHQRYEVKKKRGISPSKSDEPAVKKARGRPQKNNVLEAAPPSGEPRKRGRQSYKVKEKRGVSPSKSDEPVVKRARGRPRKNSVLEPGSPSGEPRKRGRPKKCISKSVDGLSEPDNSFTDDLKSFVDKQTIIMHNLLNQI